METFQFKCSICGEGSTRICVACTKDTCGNHMCERCRRCSDCCECDAPRGEEIPVIAEPVILAPELEMDRSPEEPSPLDEFSTSDSVY